MNIQRLKYLALHCFDRTIYPRDKSSRLTYIEKYLPAREASSYKQLVPFNVWQTWITVHLPPRLSRVINRFRQINPEYSHYLYTNKDCDDFIRKHYSGSDTEKAYFRINPAFGSARADFWRYCVLYHYGGVYLDIDSTCPIPLRKLIRPNDASVLSHESNMIRSWEEPLKALQIQTILDTPPHGSLVDIDRVLLQWLLIYTPNHPFLKYVIESTTQAILNFQESDATSRPNSHLLTLALTGPLRYTHSIWMALCENPDYVNIFRIDGSDFSGKAVFQFWGQSDKDYQKTHYSKIYSSFVIDRANHNT